MPRPITVFDKIFLALLIVTLPLAAGAYLFHAPGTVTFLLSAAAIIPLAKFIGEATEALAAKSGAALGGFLNATFGNATEIIIGVLAVRAGLIEVVKASITGSIISNLLLVLGTAMAAGGLLNKKQEFNKTAALASGSTLFVTAIALMVPAIFYQTAPQVKLATMEALSVLVSFLMLGAYAAGLFFSLHTHKHLYVEEVAKIEDGWGAKKAAAVLLFATLAVAFVSESLVDSVRPVALSLGWTQLFIGVVFIAIIGNAAEHASAVVMAVKNKMDLALQISIGSATQIAMFVAPVLVFASIAFGKPMSLLFNTFELASIILSVVIVNVIIEDGESNWLEGAQLLVAYAIMAVAFFLHP